jgi:hypothetical protein
MRDSLLRAFFSTVQLPYNTTQQVEHAIQDRKLLRDTNTWQSVSSKSKLCLNTTSPIADVPAVTADAVQVPFGLSCKTHNHASSLATWQSIASQQTISTFKNTTIFSSKACRLLPCLLHCRC